jgi:predicted secreted protein
MVAAAALSSEATEAARRWPMREIEVRANREQVEASAGDRLVVRLPENATTGYQWVVDELPEPLQLATNEFLPPSSAQPGAGGERRVELLVRGSGQGRVVLRLQRAWEREAVDRFEALVTVR